MVREARADDDGTSSVRMDCTTYITVVNAAVPILDRLLDSVFKMVSIIMPFSAITRIPRQTPTTTAAKAKSLTPMTNCSAISFSFRPPTTPIRMPIIRKMAEISSMYQPYFRIPNTITPMPTPNTSSTSLSWRLNLVSSSSMANSSFFAASSWKVMELCGFLCTLAA